MSSRRIDTAEVAKLIRADLKRGFPDYKFSVRSRRYAGGSSIDVEWRDGPTEKQVESLVGKYKGSTFDGMIDLRSYHDSDLNGESVHFGNGHLFCKRSYSPEFLKAAAIKVAAYWGVDAIPPIHISTYDGAASFETDFIVPNAGNYQYFASLVWRECNTISTIPAGELLKCSTCTDEVEAGEYVADLNLCKACAQVKQETEETAASYAEQFDAPIPVDRAITIDVVARPVQLALPGAADPIPDSPLEMLAVEQAKKSFTRDGYGMMTRDERITEGLALLLSHYFEWSGADILKVASLALEDANFHRESSQLDTMIQEITRVYHAV